MTNGYFFFTIHKIDMCKVIGSSISMNLKNKYTFRIWVYDHGLIKVAYLWGNIPHDPNSNKSIERILNNSSIYIYH